MLKKIRLWAGKLRAEVYALYLASRDPRVPIVAKLLVALVVAYVLSPIDLIPDFIPILGQLDDLMIIPLGLWIAMRLVPSDVWRECRMRAAEASGTSPPGSRIAAVVIMTIWLIALIWVGKYLWGRPWSDA